MRTNTLIGPRVTLRLMTSEDADALVAAASDGELWKIPFTVIPSRETVGAYVSRALDGLADGTMLPFVTVLRDDAAGAESAGRGKVIGSTRFWKIDRQNRKAEIGHTWIAAGWQRTFVNTECKLLMLSHAFEAMRCVRVQFSTDERNTKSRAAILRLGAKEEGILRNERIMPDGFIRNTVRFSIIDSEWPDVKRALMDALQKKA